MKLIVTLSEAARQKKGLCWTLSEVGRRLKPMAKKFDLVLKNADIITKTDLGFVRGQFQIGISAGRIAEISSSSLEGTEVLDVTGLKVIPGVIDSQVHLREPGMTHKEDLESGMRAAALGGVTSIFEMPNTIPATTTREAFQHKLDRAAQNAWVNYGFFIGGSPENVNSLAELELLPGCPGIKVFMGSSTGSLLVEDDPTLEKIFRSGRRRVILHSEDEYRLRERKHIAVDSGDVSKHHIWRDEETAIRSTRRLLALAEKCNRPVHVLHVTTLQEMEILAKHKHIASVEVLPQHLTLAAPECYERLGTLAQQNPPIREQKHQDALWKALRDGVVDILGSDHAPHTLEEKAKAYPGSPSGVPGVQTMLPLMLHHISQGRLSLERLIELVCENPRWVFGCKNKGRIEVGSDADFTILDLKKEFTITNSWIASKCAWTPFDGMKLLGGMPVASVIGGQIVLRDQALIGRNKGTAVEFFS